MVLRRIVPSLISVAVVVAALSAALGAVVDASDGDADVVAGAIDGASTADVVAPGAIDDAPDLSLRVEAAAWPDPRPLSQLDRQPPVPPPRG